MRFQKFIALVVLSLLTWNIAFGKVGELHKCNDTQDWTAAEEGHLPDESFLCYGDLLLAVEFIAHFEKGLPPLKHASALPHTATPFHAKRFIFKKEPDYLSGSPPHSMITALQIAGTITRRC